MSGKGKGNGSKGRVDSRSNEDVLSPSFNSKGGWEERVSLERKSEASPSSKPKKASSVVEEEFSSQDVLDGAKGLGDEQKGATDQAWTSEIDEGTYFVKKPSWMCYDHAICTGEAPSEPTQYNVLELLAYELSEEDQIAVISKTMLADVFWVALLGEENVAYTEHLYGTVKGQEEPSHFIGSKKLENVKYLSDVTDATHKGVRQTERQSMGEIRGGEESLRIKEGMAGNKKMTGFGSAAALSILLRSADQHPGNFALRIKGDKVVLCKFDNKLDLGANFDAYKCQFFVGRMDVFKDNYEKIFKRRVKIEVEGINGDKNLLADYMVGIRSEFNAEDFKTNLETIKKDLTTVIDIYKSQGDGLPLGDMVYEYDMGIDDKSCINYFFIEDIRSFVEEDKSVDSIDVDFLKRIYDENIEAVSSGIIEDMGAYVEAMWNKRDPFFNDELAKASSVKVLESSGNIDEMLAKIFPTKDEYLASLDELYPYSPFKFPFDKGFGKAQKEEFFGAMYILMSLDERTVSESVDKIIGADLTVGSGEKLADLLKTQLIENIEQLRSTIGKNPEYIKHVASNRDRLEESLEQAEQEMLARVEKYAASNKRVEQEMVEDLGKGESGPAISPRDDDPSSVRQKRKSVEMPANFRVQAPKGRRSVEEPSKSHAQDLRRERSKSDPGQQRE